MKCGIAIATESDSPNLLARAEALRNELRLPLVGPDDSEHDLLLVVTNERLELRETGPDRAGPVYAEFVAGKAAYRRRTSASAGKSLLAKAVGFRGKPLRVCDATAGLGRDAFVLACMGCDVTAIERSPVIAALLRDGLDRAGADPAPIDIVRERLCLIVGDARELLPQLADDERPDVVYIDPMFPPRGKTALAKKEMRICRRVTGDDPDAAELLATAMPVAGARVVVKRPLRAPTLAPDPTTVYKGTTVRYDVYLRPAKPAFR